MGGKRGEEEEEEGMGGGREGGVEEGKEREEGWRNQLCCTKEKFLWIFWYSKPAYCSHQEVAYTCWDMVDHGMALIERSWGDLITQV